MRIGHIGFLIITNNPLVRDTYAQGAPRADRNFEICYAEGDIQGLLLKVRDMVYKGHPLVSHPLPASIRMIYSPYRSVILGAVTGSLDPWHAEIAEESLRQYRQSTGHRTPDTANTRDYEWMDMQLLSSALEETQPFIAASDQKSVK